MTQINRGTNSIDRMPRDGLATKTLLAIYRQHDDELMPHLSLTAPADLGPSR